MRRFSKDDSSDFNLKRRPLKMQKNKNCIATYWSCIPHPMRHWRTWLCMTRPESQRVAKFSLGGEIRHMGMLSPPTPPRAPSSPSRFNISTFSPSAGGRGHTRERMRAYLESKLGSKCRWKSVIRPHAIFPLTITRCVAEPLEHRCSRVGGRRVN